MIASSRKDGEEVVDLLLNKEADVNMKSEDPQKIERRSRRLNGRDRL